MGWVTRLVEHDDADAVGYLVEHPVNAQALSDLAALWGLRVGLGKYPYDGSPFLRRRSSRWDDEPQIYNRERKGLRQKSSDVAVLSGNDP